MRRNPDDPVLVAKRDGRLATFLRETLDPIVGQRLSYIGRTLDMVELGLGEEVAAPTSWKMEP